jgi:predicted DsbA family dithiol-disulfide isomerase
MLQSLAEAEGIEIGSPPIQSNSHLAFELASFAREQGKAEAVHRELFHDYFTEGRNIGDIDALGDIASAAGMDRNEAREALADRRFAGVVDEEIAWARDSGITATPTFIFDERYALVGAQDYSAFEKMMERLGHSKLRTE